MKRRASYRTIGLCFALGCGVAALHACGDDSSTTTGGRGGSSGSTATGTAGTTTTGGGTAGTGGSGGGGGKGVTYCEPAYVEPVDAVQALVSDFDDEAGGGVVQTVSPGGVWQADVDATPGGSTKDETGKVEECGTTGKGFHFKSTGHTTWGAGVAAAFSSQTQPVDISKYTKLSFVLKSATPASVIVKLQNPYSQPPCGKCNDADESKDNDCYSGFTKTVSTTTDATSQSITLAAITQQTWGYHPPGVTTFDLKNAISLAFAVDQSQPNVDICVDDVKFE